MKQSERLNKLESDMIYWKKAHLELQEQFINHIKKIQKDANKRK